MKLGNIAIKEDVATISVPSNVISENTIKSVSAGLIDKCYVNVDKEDDTLQIQLKLKNIQESELQRIAFEFNNNLIQRSSEELEQEHNRNMKESIKNQAKFDSLQETGFEDTDFSVIEKNLEELESEELEDPLELSEPWSGSENTDKKESNELIQIKSK